MIVTSRPKQWFAVQVKTRFAWQVFRALTTKGYELFLPAYVQRRRYRNRTTEVERPLFPGYLFCRFDLQQRLPILTTPGVIGIVSAGRTPIPVDDSEITAIQSVVHNRIHAEPVKFLGEGCR